MFINSPYMTLPIPVVGNELGPAYAFDINAALTLIDGHDHSPGKGVQINPAGININAALTFNNNPAINMQSIVFTAQIADTTPQSLYVAPGVESPLTEDLWYTDGNGVQIQLTKNGIVNASIASIEGESYAAGTFTWTQAQDSLPTTPANFDIGSITLRPNIAATSFGVTVTPPSAIASSYSIALPLLPVATSFLTIDSTGVISSSPPLAQGITGSMIANQTITATQIANTTITNAQIANATITAAKLAFSTNINTQTFSTYTPSFTVRAATTVSGTLASSFQNGSVIDGITLVTNDLILIKNQVTSTQDGVYVVNVSGAPTRSASYNTFTQLNFAGVHVQIGTVNANTNWFQNNVLTSLSDPQTWSLAATQAFTVPAGVTEVLIIGYGGGGGGGPGYNGAAGGTAGGGGAGALQGVLLRSVTPGQVIPVTQGLGGLGGIVAVGPSTSGTATTFGSLASFLGGTGGQSGSSLSTDGKGGGTVTVQPVGGYLGGDGGTSGANGFQGYMSAYGLGGLGGAAAGGGAGGGGGGAGSTLGLANAAGGAGGSGGNPGFSAAALSGAGGGGGCAKGSSVGSSGGNGGSGFLQVVWITNV